MDSYLLGLRVLHHNHHLKANILLGFPHALLEDLHPIEGIKAKIIRGQTVISIWSMELKNVL
jgi:hypothetical protein